MMTKPPLSIAHLLLWTAMTAGVLATLRSIAEVIDLSPLTMAGRLALFAMTGIYGGVVTAGVVVWIARHLRGISFPKEAGEWLLVVQGLLMLVVLTGLQLRSQNPAILSVLFVSCWAVGLLPVIFYRGNSTWQMFFVMLSLLLFSPVLLLNPNGDGSLAVLVGMGALGVVILYLTAVTIDYRHRRAEGGWLHWVGVLSPPAYVLTVIGTLLLTFG